MSNTLRLRIPQAADLMLMPRQFWLATLGAAVVTRDWAGKEAATMFRTLVKEGAVVEAKAIRRVGERVDASVKRARRLVHDAQSGVRASAASLAGVASTFVRTKLPGARAAIAVDGATARHARVAKPRKPAGKAAKGRGVARRRTAKTGNSR